MLTVSFFGGLVGLVLGLTGAGGGILAIPALLFSLGWSLQQATPLALMAVAIAAAIGAAQGLQQGIVRYRAAIVMALAGAPFTSVGIAIAHATSARVLSLLFAAIMLIVAYRAWQSGSASKGQQTATERPVPCPLNAQTGRIIWTAKSFATIASIGALTGLLSGMLGVGGGFVIVPALRRVTHLSMHSIVATSLMVIALVGGAGAISALAHGVHIPLAEGLAFGVPTVLGMLIGRYAIRFISSTHLQKGFALLVLGVSAWLLWKSVQG